MEYMPMWVTLAALASPVLLAILSLAHESER